MGIKGLIPLLKPIQKDVHISEYAGQTVAVDGHCWLHRGAFGCASDLAREVFTQTYVAYFMNLVKMLLFNKVIPIIVFDGQRLPIKHITNESRSKLRKEKLAQGHVLYKQGRLADADKCFQQAINITPAMVANVIRELDKINVKHIVAPYEADPQLTYLVMTGQAKAVITEDSDLLAFGAEKVIVKMDRYGEGQQVAHKDMFDHFLCMRSFDSETFRYSCILSGCDYLSSLPGIGLKKAQDIVRRHKTIDGIMYSLSFLFSKKIVDEYKEKFIKANAAFLYQFVFDPTSRTYFRLNALPNEIKVDHLVGLGESPQNHDIPILKSNKAIRIDKAAIQKDANKENIDPFVTLEESEFSELEFDETVLKDVESLLGAVDPLVEPVDPLKKRKEVPTIEEVMTRAFVEVFEGAEKGLPPRTMKNKPPSPSPPPMKTFPIFRNHTSPSACLSSSVVTATLKQPDTALPAGTSIDAAAETSSQSSPPAIRAFPPSSRPQPAKKLNPFEKFKRLASNPLTRPALKSSTSKRPFALYPRLDPFKGIKPFELPVMDISQYPDPFAKVKIPFAVKPDPKRKNTFGDEKPGKSRRL